MCIYILLHALDFNTVAFLMALTSTGCSLHDLADTHFSVFCEIFFKPRTLMPTYNNFDEETVVLSG